MSSGPISQRASLGFKNINDSNRVEGLPVREKKSHRVDKASLDGMNHSNYSNKPGVSDIQSGSIHLGSNRDGKGLTSLGLHGKYQPIPRRVGGITAQEPARLRDKEARSNYEQGHHGEDFGREVISPRATNHQDNRGRDRSGIRKSPLRMSQDVSQLYPRNKIGRQVIEDNNKIQVHNSFTKLEVGNDVAKSFDNLGKIPQAG